MSDSEMPERIMNCNPDRKKLAMPKAGWIDVNIDMRKEGVKCRRS
jgi:hypothetical protein